MPLRVGAFSSGPWNFSNTVEGHGFSRAAKDGTLRGFSPGVELVLPAAAQKG